MNNTEPVVKTQTISYSLQQIVAIQGQLEEEKKRLVKQMEEIDKTLSVFNGGSKGKRGAKKGRKFSEAHRQAIAEAQKERWARHNKLVKQIEAKKSPKKSKKTVIKTPVTAPATSEVSSLAVIA